MTNIKKTDLSIYSHKAAVAASQAHGANINAVGFNLDLIAQKSPVKAVKILNLYRDVKAITPDTDGQPDEDFGMAIDELTKTIQDIDD